MYRFCRYRRGKDGQIKSEIFEIEDKSMLEDYLKSEEPGWYKHHKDVPLRSEVNNANEGDQIAIELLKGEGLNHTSYTKKKLGKMVVNIKDKQSTKKDYDAALKCFKNRIYKQNKDWFLNADNNS